MFSRLLFLHYLKRKNSLFYIKSMLSSSFKNPFKNHLLFNHLRYTQDVLFKLKFSYIVDFPVLAITWDYVKH
jgi:hypothetical protein